jgi:hypothetical protein
MDGRLHEWNIHQSLPWRKKRPGSDFRSNGRFRDSAGELRGTCNMPEKAYRPLEAGSIIQA